MKTIKLLVFLLLSITSYAQTIRRVNNNPAVPATGNVYRTLAAAHAAAAAGDIIYVEPNYQGVSYGDVTITKRVHIIGNGYSHWDNRESISVPAGMSNSIVGNLNITSGANSIIEGLFIEGTVSIQALNVILKRNWIIGSIDLIRNVSGRNGSGALITQNFVKFGGIQASGYAQNGVAYFLENVKISNNTIQTSFSSNEIQVGSFRYPGAKNIEILNNYLGGVGNCYECKIHSNVNYSISGSGSILILDNSLTLGTVASHNLCIGYSPCNFGDNNVQVPDFHMVFNSNATPHMFSDYWSKVDDLRLAEDSPAIGVGLNGVDIGPFGGPTPYRLSGLPAIPIITGYSGNASSGIYTNSTPMTVNISVKANN